VADLDQRLQLAVWKALGYDLDLPLESPSQIPSSCIRMKSVHIEDTVEVKARRDLKLCSGLAFRVPGVLRLTFDPDVRGSFSCGTWLYVTDSEVD
jgi:hypothetical protein